MEGVGGPDQVPLPRTLVRNRIRGLRLAAGWSLDDLAGRCHLSPSTLSRIETGHRRISLDQLTTLARVLGTTLDRLVAPAEDDDVVIRPRHDASRGVTAWMLGGEPGPRGMTVAKMRLTRPAPPPGAADRLGAHPGRDRFTVLSGTAELTPGSGPSWWARGRRPRSRPRSRTGSAGAAPRPRSSPSSTTRTKTAAPAPAPRQNRNRAPDRERDQAPKRTLAADRSRT
ncbi:helix-turn-helix domain-containing protein [Streptomyces sp. NPDC058374]|uniref:helix-turn-helix domain-containing protein n=1 Tax=Streptomyces sp. NPDC058374 TaxID=3346466 RepID=UPI003646696A